MAVKILLVEDDNNLREIYEARLLAEGYTIVTAKDGEEALSVAKTEKPDLVISDVMMPRISGFEMLDILRNTEDLKYTKVIMLTALGQAEDKTRANSLGADRYLVKSQVTLEDIVKAAHELLEGNPPAGAAGGTPPTTPTPAGSAPQAPAAPGSPPPTSVASPPAAAAMATPPVSLAQPLTSGAAAAPTAPAMAPAVTPRAPSLSMTPPAAPTPTAMSPSTPPSAMPVMPPVAPAPPPMGQTPPTPMPQPPSTPPRTIAIPPMPTAPATSNLNAETTAEEKAATDAQIANFVKTVEAPAAAKPLAASQADTSADDAVLAQAVNSLTTATSKPEPAAAPMATTPQPPTTPAAAAPPMPAAPPVLATPPPINPTLAPTPGTFLTTPPATPTQPTPAPSASNNNVIIANKKIIQPLKPEQSKPGIHELLAREEAKDAAAAAASNMAAPPAMATGMPAMNTSFFGAPAAQPSPASNPAPMTPQAAAPMAPMPAMPQAAPSGEFDPNNIAL